MHSARLISEKKAHDRIKNVITKNFGFRSCFQGKVTPTNENLNISTKISDVKKLMDLQNVFNLKRILMLWLEQRFR